MDLGLDHGITTFFNLHSLDITPSSINILLGEVPLLNIYSLNIDPISRLFSPILLPGIHLGPSVRQVPQDAGLFNWTQSGCLEVL